MIGEAEPIVVLHGGPGGNLTSKLDLVGIAPGYQQVFYDQSGGGESDRYPVDLERLEEATAWFSLENNVEDLEENRRKLGAQKIIVLGHSWGGALAAFYAAAHPDRVEKLVIYNGGPMWPELRSAKKAFFKARLGPELGARMAELSAGINENLETWDQNTIDAEFMKMMCLTTPFFNRQPGATPTPEEVGRGGFWVNNLTNYHIKSFDRDALALKLAKIQAPTLITYGRYEPNPPERQTYVRDAIPNNTMIVFDESGHNAHREQPELFGRLLRAFLSGEVLPMEHYDGTASTLGWTRSP